MLNNKYVISCTIIFLLSLHIVAQKKFIDAKDKITSIIDLYNENAKDQILANTILTNFNNSSKVEQQQLNKTDVGICIVLTPTDLNYLIAPAKYTYQNEKINLSAFRIRGTNEITADMQDYIIRYQTDFKTLGRSPYFTELLQTRIHTEGILTENETEHIIEEPYAISFVRGNKDWTYIISIDKAYKNIDKPQIIIYAFRKTLSKNNLFNTNNSSATANNSDAKKENLKKTNENYPLYHDARIDYLRTALGELIRFEPYKTDATLLQYYYNITEKLDRFSIRNYEEELQYFATLDISEDFLNTNFDSYFDKDYEVRNIAHLSAHALGDIYFSQNNYKLAKEYYTQAIFVDPLQTSSGTTFGKDFDRIVFDLSKNAHQAGKKNEAYAYMISMLFENTPTATKRLNEWIISDNIDQKKFKKDLDKALKSIEKEENNLYTFVFRKQIAFFLPMLSQSIEVLQNDIKESDFYTSLE